MKPFTEARNARPGERLFYNGRYQAILKHEGDWIALAVRREDRRPIIDWRDVQWIKNQILGPDVEAVQLFPDEARLVDTSNQYYLYARTEPGYRFPFGFQDRLVMQDVKITIEGHGTSQQRPFADHVRPADLEAYETQVIDFVRQLQDAKLTRRKA